MRSPRRRYDAGVTQQLLAAPYRFGYFQAVRLLELYFSRRGGRQRDIVAERLRFKNTLSLSFPPSELGEIEAHAVDGSTIEDLLQLNHAVEAGDIDTVSLTPLFFGLLGSNGALPLQYTERLIRREIYQRDRAARAFFDVFANRSAALFYSAWRKYRLHLHHELDRDGKALPVMLSLAGLNFPKLRSRLETGPGEIFSESAAYYAGALWRRPASAAMIERVVADHFGVNIRLEQFVERWYAVPAGQRTMLGQNNATLGCGAIAGERVLQCDLCARLWIGPLRRREFADFLPGGASARALAKMMQLMTGVALEYEVKLVLAAEDVSGATLSSEREDGRLGWDAFLVTRPQEHARSDAGYQLN